MRERVYLETSVIGAYFEERTDIVSKAQRFWTRRWWIVNILLIRISLGWFGSAIFLLDYMFRYYVPQTNY